MITLTPIIINNAIMGYKHKYIHIFDMERRSGKTRTIKEHLSQDWCSYSFREYSHSIIVDVMNSGQFNILKRKYDTSIFLKSDIPFLIGQKLEVLYVDEWFKLDDKDRVFIMEWCLRNRVYLNAYGTK